MKIKIILSFTAFTLLFGAFGQNNSAIDSLENILKTAKADTAKVNILNALSSQYERISDYKMSIQYAESALELATTLNYKKGIASSYNNIGSGHEVQGNYPEALEDYFASVKIKEEIGDKKGIAGSYNNIGNIYQKQGNYPEALEQYYASLKIKEEIGDKRGIANTFNNIANIYRLQLNYGEALEYYFASVKIKEEIGNKRGVAGTYINIGYMYQIQDKYTEALEYYLTSLKTFEEIGDKKYSAMAYNNIGSLYDKMGNYPEALENYIASVKIKEEIGYKEGIVNSYINIGSIYKKQGNFQDARKYLDGGLALAKKIGIKRQIRDVYNHLSTLDCAEGNFAQALEHYKMYTLYKDSLLDEESNKQLTQMTIQYETEKKDQEIELLNKDKELQEQKLEKQRLLRNGMIAGVFLIVLVGLLLFRSFRLRKKLEKQQAIIQERHRISADLHDDVGSGLSKITLLSELLKTQAKTPENRKEAEKISVTALELSSTISEIIWALNSNNDYLENMVAYIRRYAAEYFENSPVNLKIITSGEILPTPINGEHRRNIFYTVKEALNNILKHAEATEAELKFVVINNKLDVIISDNGKGIPDGDLNRFGNGINNMRARMKSIRGDFKIENHQGTRIILRLAI